MKPRIMFTGGGTGGSVTPLLAVADILRDQAALLFIGSVGGPERALVEAANIPWQEITAGKLRRYASWQNLRDLGNVWSGYRQAKNILSDWRPNVVVSAGSYVSVPVVWAAKRQGVPILIHQQDIQPGLANRLMAPAANIITVNFEISRSLFPVKKTQVIGNPVRSSILNGSAERAQQELGLDSKRPVLLVIGGGTGSSALNRLVAEALPAWLADWEIVHVTGHHRGPSITSQPHYHPHTFLTDQMADVLAAAQVVISRAGLGMMTELMALGKPCVIVPMPRTHQVANARYLSDHQAAIVLDEEHTTAQVLTGIIDDLGHDADQRSSLGQRLHELFRPNAAQDMADLILRLAQR